MKTKTALVFLSGDKEKDKKTKQLLSGVSKKVSIKYVFYPQYAFYFLEGMQVLPHIFYTTIRFSGITGVNEFVSYVDLY